ncbi:hypothetical protein ABT351_24820, partial [Micromonospora sp. NPDC000018]
MSETGQPGAATPGEHGDGPGQQDDLGRAGGGWAPSAAGWSQGHETSGAREHGPAWGPPDPGRGWAASSPRHGDLPSPLPGPPAAPEPPARVNGHHLNGVSHADDAAVDRQAPVSAPPSILGEQRRDPGGDRLVVPAQRPAPVAEQPSGPQHGLAEPETGPTRHSSADPSAGRQPRWADPGPPTSAPPAMQVPPVGTAASGFEVPPGFHAPTVDRAAAEEPSPAAGAPGWADHPFPPEPPPLAPGPFPSAAVRPPPPGASAADRPATGDRLSGVDRALGAERAFRQDHGAAPDRGPVTGQDHPPALAEQAGGSGAVGPDRAPGVDQAAAEHAPGVDRGPGVGRAAAEHGPGPDRGPGVGREPGDTRSPAAEWPPATEPDWSGPNWNRPSWGGGWAPPWSREESEPVGRRARDESASTGRRSRAEDEPVGRRAREEDEPVGRRSREDRAAAWAAEPHRPYEPPRAELPGRSYEPPRAEPGRPYEVGRAESAPRPAYEPPADPADRAASSAADRSIPVPVERPGEPHQAARAYAARADHLPHRRGPG